ncbi:oxygenase MpaB family protein [Acinetobacter pittii]|uniref:oxygenase MpaB family protein n=1 Tax=Acinetobacter pittii TaxID=48296 RepID=UPI002AFEB84E|nr:oxygenase MpaB family protein [Acinetobacter pittii]
MLTKYSYTVVENPNAMKRFPFNVVSKFFNKDALNATEAQIASFNCFRQIGDPVADNLVECMHRVGSSSRHMFNQALEYGIETVDNPPQELIDFFSVVDNIPYWVDQKRLDRATRLYKTIGKEAFTIFLPGLAVSYVAPVANHVLLRSGDLYKKAGKRAVETLNWFNEVTAPNGMSSRFSSGYKACIQIRMVHAHMRKAMKSKNDWDFDQWDEPIHQVIYTATILPFALLATLGANILGILSAKQEREDIFHLWRLIAHVVGVHPSLIPTNEADIWRLTWIELDQVFIPDETSAMLGGALWQSLDEIIGFDQNKLKDRIKRKMTQDYISTLSHLMLGKEIASSLTFPKKSMTGMALIGGSFVKNFVVTSVARVVPNGIDHLGKYKAKQRNQFMQRIIKNTRADLSYERR